jgi:adenylate cyclase
MVRVSRPERILTTLVLILAGFWSTALAVQHMKGDASALDRAEAPLADLRFLIAGPRAPPPGVSIVVIDDDTVQSVGRFPLPRDVLAKILQAISRSGAKTIAIDILFLDPGEEHADKALAEALSRTRTVIAAAAVFSSGKGPNAQPATAAGLPKAQRIIWPLPRLSQVAAVGLTNVATDAGGVPRHVPLLTALEDTLQPSFPLRAAAIAAAIDPVVTGDQIWIGPAATQLDVGAHLPLRFYGGRGTIPTMSAKRILEDASAADGLEDRIVLIGAAATGIGDTYATPFDAVLPGVEVLATAVSHLMSGDGLVRNRMTRRIDVAATFIVPALLLFLMAFRPVGLAAVLATLMVSVWLGLTTLAFAYGWWLSLAVPAAAALPAVLLNGIARLWLDQRNENRLGSEKAALRRFQPAILADRVETEPGFLAEPVKQDAALLFVDLTRFTGLAERVGPERTQALLGEFHRILDQEITQRAGLVLTYMGDGAMAVFGIPSPRADDAAHAVEAGRDLATKVLTWLRSFPEASLAAGVSVKLGAHWGPVMVSRLGGETHQHITVTGDSVNVASRLMECASERGALLACSLDLLTRTAGRPDLAAAFTNPEQMDIRGRAAGLAVCFWNPAH